MPTQVQVSRFGGAEVFQAKEVPSAQLASDSVRIQVKAAGVNFADVMARMGMYPEAGKPPFTLGYEVAGVITEVGAAVKQFKPGDRVVAATKFGGYTTELVLKAHQVRKIPDNLSDAEAASIPVNWMTAWVALEEMGRVRKGDRVLIQSAAGGVGVAAVQIAARRGAHVVGLVGSPSKAQAVKDLGAHEIFTNEEWEASSDAESRYKGFDIVLDAAGGKMLKQSFRRLAKGGRVINFGLSTAVGEKRSILKLIRTVLNTPLYNPLGLMNSCKGVFGLNMLQLIEEPKPGEVSLMERAFDSVLEGFEKGEFKAIVGKTFPLVDAGAAQAYLQGRGNIGKVVLTN